MLVSRVLEQHLLDVSTRFPVVTVTGPRQSGKTTLCRMAFPDKPHVSLEAPDVRADAGRDPRGLLESHRDGAILDEVHRVPELLSYIQEEVDNDPRPGRFVLSGSANLALLESVTQSLAGRTAFVNLYPFGPDELSGFPQVPEDLFATLWYGGYPAIFDRGIPPGEWHAHYVQAYLERDVRQIVNVGNLLAFQTFVGLCAGRAAQLVNLSALGADAGVSHGTVRSWLSILEAGFIIKRIPPLAMNIRKRLVKTPKLVFLDTGLLCYLLGIREPEQLRQHPLRGAVFENWVSSEILKAHAHRGLDTRFSFFRDHKGTEVDLVADTGDRLLAVEAKSARTITPGFFKALDKFESWAREDPRLAEVVKHIVYGGDRNFRSRGSQVLPWNQIVSLGTEKR